MNADARHKLIRRYDGERRGVHDSQKLDELLTKGNTSTTCLPTAPIARPRPRRRLRRRASGAASTSARRRGHPLSKAKAERTAKKSRVRARIEHVFGAQETAPGGRIVRTIGIVRAQGQDRLAEPRLQHPSPGDTRTQEVSLVQIGEPTGCRLRAEPARRGEKSRRRAANMRRYTNRRNVRSPIFDEIRHRVRS